jgi:branched-chain amino acid transport system permease protein
MTTFIQQVVNGLMTGSTYAVVALGFGLIFSVMRVLNMAHPDLAMLGAYVAYLITQTMTSSLPTLPLLLSILLFVAILAAGAGAASVGGLVIERLVIRPTRGTYILIPFIATAGIGIFLENSANTIFGSNPVSVHPVLPFDIVNIGGVSFTTMQLATFLTSIAMMIALRHYVRRTKWGLATRAVAELPEVAAAYGVNVNGVSQLSIGIASAMAGAAGATIALLQTSADPFMGLLLGLKSFVCMLVAGNRHIEGILVVGLALGVIEALVTGYISSQYRDAVAFSLLLGILVFRPRGIFGSYAT